MYTFNNEKGFTLIELVVVIGVLGILAAIAIPRLGGVKNSAKEAAFIADVNTMESIINYYALSRSEHPSTTTDGTGDFSDEEWNEYARDHLDDFIVGGWPTETPWGGYFAYRAYPEDPGNWINNWRNLKNGASITDRVGDQPFEIIMIRFVTSDDEEGFKKAKAALEKSNFKNKVYIYGNQKNIGIPVIY